jgi:BASS family bile acid:Na+ symporter
VVGLNRDRLSAITGQVALALLLLNLLGYLAGWWGGVLLRLPDAMRRALTLEVGMQNAGLGASLATTLFANAPAAALPPELYAFGCMLTGTILAQWMARSAASEDTSAGTPATGGDLPLD